MGNKISLEDELVNLRMTSKSMNRASTKCKKNEKVALDKLKKAIKLGNTEGARIYAQDAIREKNQSLNHLRMASRIDAVAARLETAIRTEQVNSSMKGVVKGMSRGMASMNVEQISKTMDQFERQFEDLDVRSGFMEDAMNTTTATQTPADQVDTLIKMVADENSLELGDAFLEAGPVGTKVPETEKPVEAEKDDLATRLANLRN